MQEGMKIDWSILFGAREEVQRRYRSIWKVPIARKRDFLFKQFLKQGDQLLDVGAGSRSAEKELNRLGIGIVYKSMDVDRNIRHDYYDLEQIEERFNGVLLSEVIEHLPLVNGLKLLTHCNNVLEEKGVLFVSTPNIYHPYKFLTTADHKTAYAYDELSGLLSLAGFKVRSLYRLYNDNFHRYIMKVYLFSFLFKFLSIDFAPSIIAVAEK